jgi:hypothetical protein
MISHDTRLNQKTLEICDPHTGIPRLATISRAYEPKTTVISAKILGKGRSEVKEKFSAKAYCGTVV